MKEPSAHSPFAAMTPQEQRHRWTVWQAQQMQAQQPIQSASRQPKTTEAQNRPSTKQTDVCTLTENLREQEAVPVSAPPTPLRAAIRHSQYDAVMKRMKQASLSAGQYMTVSGTDSTSEPSSGKA